MTVDSETTGLDTGSPRTFITQIGYALGIDRVCVDHHDFVLDWTIGPAAIPEATYRAAIEQVTTQMAARGSTYRISWEMVKGRGVEPLAALAHFRELLVDSQEGGFSIAGHNIYAYDRPLFEHCFRRHTDPFVFDVERMIDTGLLEKCRKMRWQPPHPGECSRAEWYRAVSKEFSRETWSLEKACSPLYSLADRIGGVGNGMAHTASFDCLLVHHLMDAMRERAEGPLVTA